MYRLISMAKKLLSLAILVGSLIVTGCSPGRYYLFKPTVFEKVAADEANQRDEILPAVTDAIVVSHSNAAKNTLRERMNKARVARTAGGFIQVVTAAVSSLLTGTSGGSAVGAATILSGTSAIIPEVSDVIGAKERAEVYQDGVQAIETAEALYLKTIAETEGGKINREKLTSAGAKLHETVVAAIHVVEDRLTGQLPTVEKLRKMRENPRPLGLSGSEVKDLKVGKAIQVTVTRGGPAVHEESSDLSVATVVRDPGGGSVTITGMKGGEANITVENENGGTAKVKVKVTQ